MIVVCLRFWCLRSLALSIFDHSQRLVDHSSTLTSISNYDCAVFNCNYWPLRGPRNILSVSSLWLWEYFPSVINYLLVIFIELNYQCGYDCKHVDLPVLFIDIDIDFFRDHSLHMHIEHWIQPNHAIYGPIDSSELQSKPFFLTITHNYLLCIWYLRAYAHIAIAISDIIHLLFLLRHYQRCSYFFISLPVFHAAVRSTAMML